MQKYNTEQRKLLHVFFTQHPHEMFSAKEIADILGSESVSISAVYRNLAALESMGLVRRCTKAGSREAYYQYNGTQECQERIHLTCKKCGQTTHMDIHDTNSLVQSAAKYKNFFIDKTKTVLYGICGACQKEA